MATASIADLKKEIALIGEKFPLLQDDDLFIVWFLRYLTDSDDDAQRALVGGAGEKSVDAVYIDENAKIVYIIQGKYRHKLLAKSEKREDVVAFAQLAQVILGDPKVFAEHLNEVPQNVRVVMENARERIARRKFRLRLQFVTTGKCSESVKAEAERTLRGVHDRADIEVIEGRKLMLILEDYLDGVAPPVPTLELEMESGNGVKTSGVLQRYDANVGIEAWVFTMNGAAVADLFIKSGGERLFARNVRGYLGKTDINRNMEYTLEHEPEHFWCYNNGITIICDEAETKGKSGRDILRVSNPQIINGQQTTRELHRMKHHSRNASVLVRVIRVPREKEEHKRNFEKLVGKIVMNTNWQNKIGAADLKANDQKQIEIERGFKKYGLYYLRKRRTKNEARALAGKSRHIVKKEELAQAIAACDLDPAIVRSEGKEGLFEDRWYDVIFATNDPLYYLRRYAVMRTVSTCTYGFPERAYAKWMILHFIWDHVAASLRSREAALELINSTGTYMGVQEALKAATTTALLAAMRFYRKERGIGPTAHDHSTFFRKRGLYKDFERFWKGGGNSRRGAFKKNVARFRRELAGV